MKSIIWPVLIGVFLVTVIYETNAVKIDSVTQNEMNRRLYVQGAMDGNITLVSNSPIGLGSFSFVLSGLTDKDTPVAIKATSEKYLLYYTQEYKCYEKMNATRDKGCEKYGIPFIYHCGDFLDFKTIAMTKLDFTLVSLQCKIGSFSRDSTLIIFRDLIKTLKFVHSKGIINQNIKRDNIMTKGANVFLMDFNIGVDKTLKSHIQEQLWMHDSNEHSEMLWLFYIMCNLVDVQPYTTANKILESDMEIGEKKRQMKEALHKMKYTDLVEPFSEYFSEVVKAMKEERLPKYDYLYNMFDDILYAGRNRSLRIVFEWLTPEERAFAMSEIIPSIESIVFPEEKAH